jgi:hypothetical protein
VAGASLAPRSEQGLALISPAGRKDGSDFYLVNRLQGCAGELFDRMGSTAELRQWRSVEEVLRASNGAIDLNQSEQKTGK